MKQQNRPIEQFPKHGIIILEKQVFKKVLQFIILELFKMKACKGEKKMKKFSKVFALGLATTMLGGILVGCSQDSTPAPTTDNTQTSTSTETQPQTTETKQETAVQEEVKKDVKLRTVSMFGGTDPNTATYQKYQASFVEANPHVTINDESATADETWKASIVTDFSASNEPDVMFFFTDVTSAPIVDQNKVVSIEEIRAEYPDYAANINPAALQSAACPDGVQYAIPTHGYYEALFCNEDLFAANNLELPTDWAKFEAAIEGFAQTDITPIAVALGHVPHYWIEHLILAVGGVEDHGNRDIEAVKDTWVEGLGYFKTLADLGAFPIDTASTQNDLVQVAFQDKQAAMFLDGSWAVGALQGQDNVTALPIPTLNASKNDGTQLISGFSSGYYISRKAWEDPDKRQACVDYVMHMTQTDVIAEMVTVAGGGAPAADVGTLSGLSELGQKGSAVAGKATGVDGAIDGWLAKDAWDYLLQQVPLIAAGKTEAVDVVEGVLTRHNDN